MLDSCSSVIGFNKLPFFLILHIRAQEEVVLCPDWQFAWGIEKWPGFKAVIGRSKITFLLSTDNCIQNASL